MLAVIFSMVTIRWNCQLVASDTSWQISKVTFRRKQLNWKASQNIYAKHSLSSPTPATAAPTLARPDCKGLFRKCYVGRQGHVRDEIEMLAGGTIWSCCAKKPEATNANKEVDEKSSRMRTMGRGSITILQWHADGITLKIDELRERMKELEVDAALMQETKLKSEGKKTDKTPKKEKNRSIRADRVGDHLDRRGDHLSGGLFTYVKKDILFISQPCYGYRRTNQWLNIKNVYIPPNSNSGEEILVLDSFPAGKDWIIGSGFNARSKLWDNTQPQHSSRRVVSRQRPPMCQRWINNKCKQRHSATKLNRSILCAC